MKKRNSNGRKYSYHQMMDFKDRYKAGEPIWSISPKIGVKPQTLHSWKRSFFTDPLKASEEYRIKCFKSDFIRYNGNHTRIAEGLGISRKRAIELHKQYFPEILDKTAMTAKLYHMKCLSVNEISYFLSQTIESTKAIIRKIKKVNEICSPQNQNQDESSR